MNSTSFWPLRGFHTTSTTRLTLPYLAEHCSLHIWYSLPPTVFPDTYELANYASDYSAQYDGIRNLELPIVAVDENVQGSLLLDVKAPHGQHVDVEVKVPLHMRYGKPSEHGGTIEVTIPHPKAFTACSSSGQRATTELELPNQVLGHLSHKIITPIPFSLTSSGSITIPVGNTSDLPFVETGTAALVLICSLYLLHAFWRTAQNLSLHKANEPKED